ncbi:MAG: hypothetical protein ACP5UV_02520 [Thermoplasmata archaeon]
MGTERYDYYLKLILNSPVTEYPYISEKYQNDSEIAVLEAESLDRIILKYLSIYKKSDVRVVNVITGQEEMAPLSMIDDFGGNAVFMGEETMYGINWKTYIPPKGFERSAVKKWYYNEKIASILNDTLSDVVPGRVKNYYDIPPWVLGTKYAPDSKYLPLYDIISEAIIRNTIPGWYYLIKLGIPQEFIDAIRTRSVPF